MVRVQLETGRFATIGTLQRLNVNDLEYYIEYLMERLGIIIEDYEQVKVTRVIFSYASRDLMKK